MPMLPPRHRPPGCKPYRRPPQPDDGFYKTTAWRDLRESVLRRDGHSCVRCGARGTRLVVDHVKPRREGGSDDPSNLPRRFDAVDGLT